MARGGKRPGAGRKPNPHKGKSTPKRNPQAAPRSYDPTVAEQAIKLCQLGATDLELADFFGVATSTIYRWKIEFPDFSESLKVGKGVCDDRVEASLYHRAVGYSFEAVKVFNDKGAALIVPYREHVPPDFQSMSLWLRNRRKDVWRDKVDHEVSGPSGGPIETKQVDARELIASRIAELAARGAEDNDASGAE